MRHYSPVHNTRGAFQGWVGYRESVGRRSSSCHNYSATFLSRGVILLHTSLRSPFLYSAGTSKRIILLCRILVANLGLLNIYSFPGLGIPLQNCWFTVRFAEVSLLHYTLCSGIPSSLHNLLRRPFFTITGIPSIQHRHIQNNTYRAGPL